ncbi:recombinase family protein [Desulfoscipio gibsoniae]
MKVRYAVAYARVSDPRQADKGVSIPAQFGAMRKWAADNNVLIVVEAADEGKSAYREDVKRVKFDFLIDYAKRDPKVSLFLIHDGSRFCRIKRKANLLKSELEEHGVYVIPTSSPYDATTIQGKWMESIDETRSETESMATSLHVLEKMKGHIAIRDSETGWCYKNGGRAPAGYRNIRVQRGIDHRGFPILKQLWEPDPEWAPVLREIVVECKIKKRMSHKAIVEHLNSPEKGIKSPEGRPICVSFINEMFREDRLLQAAGFAFWNREDRRAKGRRFKDKEEWVRVENAHPAIITEDEARLAREICGQKQRSKVPPRLDDSPWLFTGKNHDGEDFFICLACKGRMASFVQGGRHHDKYRCGTLTYQGRGSCHDVRIEKKWLESEVIKLIKLRFSDEEIEGLVNKVAAAVDAESAEYRQAVKRIDKAIKDSKTEIDNLVRAVATGKNVDLFNEAINKRREEIAELEKQKEKLALSKPTIEKIDIVRLKEYINSLDKVLLHGSNRERREFIRTFIRRMELDPLANRITIYWYADPVQTQITGISIERDVRFLTGVGGGT